MLVLVSLSIFSCNERAFSVYFVSLFVLYNAFFCLGIEVALFSFLAMDSLRDWVSRSVAEGSNEDTLHLNDAFASFKSWYEMHNREVLILGGFNSVFTTVLGSLGYPSRSSKTGNVFFALKVKLPKNPSKDDQVCRVSVLLSGGVSPIEKRVFENSPRNILLKQKKADGNDFGLMIQKDMNEKRCDHGLDACIGTCNVNGAEELVNILPV